MDLSNKLILNTRRQHRRTYFHSYEVQNRQNKSTVLEVKTVPWESRDGMVLTYTKLELCTPKYEITISSTYGTFIKIGHFNDKSSILNNKW